MRLISPFSPLTKQGQLIAIVNKTYDEWWEGYTIDDPDTRGLFCILLVDQQPLGGQYFPIILQFNCQLTVSNVVYNTAHCHDIT